MLVWRMAGVYAAKEHLLTRFERESGRLGCWPAIGPLVPEGTTRQGSSHQGAFSRPDQRVSGRSMVVINAITMQPVT